jgi:hypothetical protein
MLEETLIPAIRSRIRETIRADGVRFRSFETRSRTFERLPDRPGPVRSILREFSGGIRQLRIEGMMRPSAAILDQGCGKTRKLLGEFLFAEGEDTIDTVVAKLFRKGIPPLPNRVPAAL